MHEHRAGVRTLTKLELVQLCTEQFVLLLVAVQLVAHQVHQRTACLVNTARLVLELANLAALFTRQCLVARAASRVRGARCWHRCGRRYSNVRGRRVPAANGQQAIVTAAGRLDGFRAHHGGRECATRAKRDPRCPFKRPIPLPRARTAVPIRGPLPSPGALPPCQHAERGRRGIAHRRPSQQSRHMSDRH